MAIGAEIAAAEPAIVDAIWIGTEVRLGVDGAPASSGAGDEGRWRAWCLGVFVGSLLTGLAERFVDEARKGLGFCGTFTSAFVGFGGRFWCTGRAVGPPDIDEEADQHESD
jgi:hypothetical protein